MDIVEIEGNLRSLLDTLIEKDHCLKALTESEADVSNITHHFLGKLDEYDREHKDTFITEKIGKAPIKPKGLIKIAVPVYLAKKTKYEKAMLTYQKLYPLAESAYREEHQAARTSLAQQDEIEKEAALRSAQEVFRTAKERYDAIKQKLDADNTLSAKFKTVEIVSEILEYFEDGRVETIKEAVNLWYNEQQKAEEARKAEEHRQQILALEEEKVRAAQAAEEYQRQQCVLAQQAAQYAREAAESAQQAASDIQLNQYFSDK